jgi:hypothetical protein
MPEPVLARTPIDQGQQIAFQLGPKLGLDVDHRRRAETKDGSAHDWISNSVRSKRLPPRTKAVVPLSRNAERAKGMAHATVL